MAAELSKHLTRREEKGGKEVILDEEKNSKRLTRSS